MKKTVQTVSVAERVLGNTSSAVIELEGEYFPISFHMKPPTLLWKVHIVCERYVSYDSLQLPRQLWGRFFIEVRLSSSVVCSMVGAMSLNNLYGGRDSMNHSLSQIPHWFWRLTLHQSQTQTQVCLKKTKSKKDPDTDKSVFQNGI